jgi:hypothetical protein
VLRDVATTESPLASAASAMARPNPLVAPVMSHVRVSFIAPLDRVEGLAEGLELCVID